MEQQTTPALQGQVRMYHGTHERFKQFDLKFAARPGMSGNGHLGVWLAIKHELAQRFGKVCLDVDVQVDQPYLMPLAELRRLTDRCNRLTSDMDDAEQASTERMFYQAYRTELLLQGYDIIYLEETDGRIEMAIGLVPDKLTIQ